MWRRLNVFIAWTSVATLGLSVLLQVPLQISILLALIVPAWAWVKGSLIPKANVHARGSRLSWGDWLLFAANLLVFIGLFLPIIAGRLLNRDDWFVYSMIGGLLLWPAIPMWVVGLSCIYSSQRGLANG